MAAVCNEHEEAEELSGTLTVKSEMQAKLFEELWKKKTCGLSWWSGKMLRKVMFVAMRKLPVRGGTQAGRVQRPGGQGPSEATRMVGKPKKNESPVPFVEGQGTFS